MDEIAALQGISKKTIYKFFPNKRALIATAIDETMLEAEARVSSVADDPGRPFLERLWEILRVVSRQLGELGETLIKDLYYHEPELWARIDRFRREHIFGIITRLFEEGMREGFIRSDTHGSLVPLLFINALSSVMTPAQFVNLPLAPAELFEAFIRILFEGILTDNARRRFFAQEGKK